MWAGRDTAVARPAGPARGRRLGAATFVLVALGVLLAWLYLAPGQVGGSTAYAVIVGNSMEPKLEQGDLVLVRAREQYGPGDVVLYDDARLGSKVLHRIVRAEGDRFVLKGDNNDFLDTAKPTADDIVGELWLTVPAAGGVATWLRNPLHAAFVIGIAAFFALAGGAAASGTNRRSSRPRPRAGGAADFAGHLPAAVAFACVAFAALTVVAFTRPPARELPAVQPYAHEGRLAYAAAVPRSAVYPDGRVSTGEPVFLRLVRRLRVDVDYRLAADVPAVARGRIGLTAKLTDGRGWTRVFQVAPEREFAGTVAGTGGTLDLARVQTLIEELQTLTGSSAATYSLTLQSHVRSEGTVQGRPFDETFGPSIEFELADQRLQPTVEARAELGPQVYRQPGTGTASVDASIRLGPVELPVAEARRVGLAGLAGTLLVGAAAVVLMRRRVGRDEVSEITSRHGRLLVEVSSPGVDESRVFDLPDMETLARVAEHHGLLILHSQDGNDHVFLVEADETLFRYRARTVDVDRAEGPVMLPPVLADAEW